MLQPHTECTMIFTKEVDCSYLAGKKYIANCIIFSDSIDMYLDKISTILSQAWIMNSTRHASQIWLCDQTGHVHIIRCAKAHTEYSKLLVK